MIVRVMYGVVRDGITSRRGIIQVNCRLQISDCRLISRASRSEPGPNEDHQPGCPCELCADKSVATVQPGDQRRNSWCVILGPGRLREQVVDKVDPARSQERQREI